MTINRISIRDLGSLLSYDARLDSSLNILHTRCCAELWAALSFLICSKSTSIPQRWIRKSTRIIAQIQLGDRLYFVKAAPENRSLTLTALDLQQTDVTEDYINALAHCREQDAIDCFNGLDKTVSSRLYQYKNSKDLSICHRLEDETGYYSETKTFRTQLIRYIKNFRPEPINHRKKHLITVDQHGRFQTTYPGIPEPVCLSETEEKLFRYICFLNIAEFWSDIETIRDLHHEKKPLLIQNFLEYLDESTDIRHLIKRTIQLQRQIIMLTLPLDDETARNWILDH